MMSLCLQMITACRFTSLCAASSEAVFPALTCVVSGAADNTLAIGLGVGLGLGILLLVAAIVLAVVLVRRRRLKQTRQPATLSVVIQVSSRSCALWCDAPAAVPIS